VQVDNGSIVAWRLRSSLALIGQNFEHFNGFAAVNREGAITPYQESTNNIRPAMWVDMSERFE